MNSKVKDIPESKPGKTRDALEIIDILFFQGKPNEADLRRRLEEEIERSKIAEQIYTMRTEAGLTQRELAALIKTSASNIARLEDADYPGHSMSMLRRIASALKSHVEVRFLPESAAVLTGNAAVKATLKNGLLLV